jgi:hypothetical protein
MVFGIKARNDDVPASVPKMLGHLLGLSIFVCNKIFSIFTCPAQVLIEYLTLGHEFKRRIK